jgi:hypothetical protein
VLRLGVKTSLVAVTLMAVAEMLLEVGVDASSDFLV